MVENRTARPCDRRAPRGLPADVLAWIEEVFAKPVGSEEFRAFAAKAMTTPGSLGAADYRKVVEAERALYAKIVLALWLGKR